MSACTYTEANTINLKLCLKDLKWLIKSYKDIQSHIACTQVVVPTERGVFDTEIGLCSNILLPNGVVGDAALWCDWDYYTGNECYPVAGESEYEDSDHLYLTNWRKHLAQHCADKIKAELRSRGAIC